jgi:DNA-binding NtrC family response regulator
MRILVVEDEAQVLTLTESILQEHGHQTLTASTVAEAQAMIHSQESIDLVLTDIVLANHPEGGITVGQLVEQSRQGTPVLYTSGRPVTDGMRSLFAARSDFLQKPFTAQQLIEAMDKLRAQ